MSTAFQVNAFQLSAFQITPPVVEEPTWDGTTILNKYKVDPPHWRAGAISRKRYSDYKEQWRIDGINAKRALKQKKREIDKDLGLRKIDYDQYKFQVNVGEALHHNLLLDLEHQQAQRAALQAQVHTAQAAARLAAIGAFQRRAAMEVARAEHQQFSRDSAEELEAMELLEMMDDDD